ncbi:MAG: signal peptidase I [Alphaproteobacteria bacterium]|nr:MAG: signal peptidase I [Alphaproteobacteria bacterium]
MHDSSDSFGSLIRLIIYAALVALVVRAVGLEPFTIPSSSMVPTLLVGDFVFVSKGSYGYSSMSTMPLVPKMFDGRLMFTPPKRGDVAVFKLPRDGKTDYIKRLIGMPGDRIQMREGRLYINGEMVARAYMGTVRMASPYGGPGASATVYRETLPGGREHIILEESDHHPLDNTPEYLVPEGHYFMMGDNRDNSQDSRTQLVGYVPLENLVGRADTLVFSIREGTSVWKPWTWFTALRGSRFFLDIQTSMAAPAQMMP